MFTKKEDKSYYADINAYLGIAVVPKVFAKTVELERQGVFIWLKTIFPETFEEDFSAEHQQFWQLYWSVLMRIREQKICASLNAPPPKKAHIEPKEFVVLLILGRGLGKSATIETSAVMRGAILGGGYCLYVCESQDQADEHIGNCKLLIESPESRLLDYYPKMEIADVSTIEGIRAKDRTDIFITNNGWICRSKGLNAKLRGLRIGNRRPDDIAVDDVDSVNDTPDVSHKKLRQLTASVIPTQARKYTTIKFGQNLITETGVINQIFTGKADALAERTTIGVQNTFTELEYDTYLDESDGRVRHRILPSSVPSWSGVDLQQAQKFLNDSGLETFLAEYQNEFEHLRTGHVFHEFDESRHVVSWRDFQRVFNVRHIPAHWQTKVTADIGYSNESLSAWMFVATSAANSPLPNHYFCYRGITFQQKSIDDQAERLWEMMFPQPATGKNHFEATQTFTDYPELFRLLSTKPHCKAFLDSYVYNTQTNTFAKPLQTSDISPVVAYAPQGTGAVDETDALYYVNRAELSFSGQIVQWTISHEKTGEQKTLAQKYGIPARKTTRFGADDGVAEANHLLRGDYTRPHPFQDDVQDENGLWHLGCPYIFFLVDDDQVISPRDDNGLKLFREQTAAQRWTQEKLTALGLTRSVPMKYQSDCGDAFRMWACEYALPNPTPLTMIEEFNRLLPDHAKPKKGVPITLEQQMSNDLQMELAAEKLAEKYGLYDEDDEDDY